MGVCVPEEHGGAGADFLSYILVLEELSRADAGVGVTVAVHTSACTLPILAFGTEEQRERFVPPLARGETIGAFALTEPESGSDAGSLRTTARRGRTTAGASRARSSGSRPARTRARSCSSPAPTRRSDGARGVSAFVLDREHVRGDARGGEARAQLVVDRRPERSTRTWTATGCCTRSGKGFTVAMATLDGGRIGIAAQAVGIAQAAYDVARAYAKERKSFGKPIAEHQAIQFKLADMSTEIDAARLLTYRAAWLKEQGEPHTEARRQGEALRLRDGDARQTPRRSRSSAATATRRSSRSSATTATRRSRRSTRARARSSGS